MNNKNKNKPQEEPISSPQPVQEDKSEQIVKEEKPTIEALTLSVTVEPISSPQPVQEDKRLVAIDVKYPSDFSEKKYMSEGIRKVSKEVADQFVSMGIAKKV